MEARAQGPMEVAEPVIVQSRAVGARGTLWCMIGENRAQKVYILKSIFKVCVFWLPRYFRYSMEAKTSRIYKDGRR